MYLRRPEQRALGLGGPHRFQKRGAVDDQPPGKRRLHLPGDVLLEAVPLLDALGQEIWGRCGFA